VHVNCLDLRVKCLCSLLSPSPAWRSYRRRQFPSPFGFAALSTVSSTFSSTARLIHSGSNRAIFQTTWTIHASITPKPNERNNNDPYAISTAASTDGHPYCIYRRRALMSCETISAPGNRARTVLRVLRRPVRRSLADRGDRRTDSRSHPVLTAGRRQNPLSATYCL